LELMAQTPEERKAKEKAYRRKYYLEHRKNWISYSRTSREKRAKWYQDYKRNLKCSMCGKSFPDYPEVIDLHHEGDRAESQDQRISELVTSNAPLPRVKAELAKCIPLCANCHRRLHDSERKEQWA